MASISLEERVSYDLLHFPSSRVIFQHRKSPASSASM